MFRFISIKEFTYRGSDEEWSNTYVFDGTAPVGFAAWEAFADDWATDEASILPATVDIVKFYGYADADPDSSPAYVHDWRVPPSGPRAGTFSMTGRLALPGDSAAWIRWSTGRLSLKGKKVFLRKYYHPAIVTSGESVDEVAAGWITAAEAFAQDLIDGTGAAGVTLADPHDGETPVEMGVAPFVTTRTLKRRGKRPLASP